MKRTIYAAFAALLLFGSSAAVTARPPTKIQEINGNLFGPVTVTDLVIRDYWGTPRPIVDRPRTEIEQPSPIIQNLTLPTSTVHTVNEAKSYALAVLGAVEYSCIDKIFTRESNWNTLDVNKNSGAYGIPQALPGSKMSTMGSDWRTNPVTQVKWGIRYVTVRYGSACNGWRFWQSHGWY